MKRIKVDNKQESLILTGMIISDRFLRDIQTVLDIKLLKSSHSRKIAKWCLDYFKEFQKSPGAHIQDIFNEKAENGKIQDEDIQMIGNVLDRISKEFSRSDVFNAGYVLKLAEKYFNIAHTKKICEEVLENIDSNPFESTDLLLDYAPKKVPSSVGYDVLTDMELIKRSFEEVQKPLFKMPGALGLLINNELTRGSFVGLLGPEKIGKTWNLLEFGIQAAKSRLNVAFFQAGDMTDEQQTRRLSIRITGRNDQKRFCGKVFVPVYDCFHNQTDKCDIRERKSKYGLDGIKTIKELHEILKNKREREEFIEDQNRSGYKPCDYCRRNKKLKWSYSGSVWYKTELVKPLNWKDAFKATKKFRRQMGGKNFKLVSYPNFTLTVREIESVLDAWAEQNGFIVDVLILDYADLLHPEENMDYRHQQNRIWMRLRSISQKYDNLLITATQADADSYGKEYLELKNFSEDKRKYAHATCFISLNQTQEEKNMGIIRYGKMLAREDEFDIRNHVAVMQCLSKGKPHVGSFFKRI